MTGSRGHAYSMSEPATPVRAPERGSHGDCETPTISTPDLQFLGHLACPYVNMLGIYIHRSRY